MQTDRDSKLGPLKIKSGALPTELHVHVQCICNFLCPGFLIHLIPLERSGSKILGLRGWAIWWWWLNQCDRHIPKSKNYWKKSEEHKLTWSYFDQSQVRISELWAGITVWGVSGLLASHTLTVWSPVLKKW